MKIKNYKNIIIICTIIFAFLGTIAFRYGTIISQCNRIKSKGYEKFTITQHPFYTENDIIEFLIDNPKGIDLKLWWKGLTGSTEVKIRDTRGNTCFKEIAGNINKEKNILLKPGKYKLYININSFTGAINIGYRNVFKVIKLPALNYNIVNSNPSKGFQWKYILYIPSKVTKSNILVEPNNTALVSDNIDIHEEAAKDLAQNSSKLAEKLGVPLMIPIFPRPRTYANLYTHALDRGTILSNINKLRRLDLQLISMINDAKDRLIKKGIKIDSKILMAGFSASGDFTDRFTFLHPEIVKAACIGGCNNVIPMKNINDENLPYPIGTYDYKKITGKEFDINSFSNVYRYVFKGSKDEGGWQTTDENGKVTIYTAKEYFERFQKPQLIIDLKKCNSQIYTKGRLTDEESNEILYNAYKGKTFFQRFLAVKSIFKKIGLNKNEFIIYDGISHEMTNKIEDDELKFFKQLLRK